MPYKIQIKTIGEKNEIFEKHKQFQYKNGKEIWKSWVKIRVLKNKSKSGFVAVFGTFIEANLDKKHVNSGFGEVSKCSKKYFLKIMKK